MGGTPTRGVPHLRYPPPGPGLVGVPQLGGAGGWYPTSDNRWSTWYAEVGMPLASTQEDFLVYFYKRCPESWMLVMFFNMSALKITFSSMQIRECVSPVPMLRLRQCMDTGVPFPVSGHSSALARISWAEVETRCTSHNRLYDVDMMPIEAVRGGERSWR